MDQSWCHVFKWKGSLWVSAHLCWVRNNSAAHRRVGVPQICFDFQANIHGIDVCKLNRINSYEDIFLKTNKLQYTCIHQPEKSSDFSCKSSYIRYAIKVYHFCCLYRIPNSGFTLQIGIGKIGIEASIDTRTSTWLSKQFKMISCKAKEIVLLILFMVHKTVEKLEIRQNKLWNLKFFSKKL